MLQVLTRENWAGEDETLEQMFRLRHRVLYEELRWAETYSADGLDRDGCDHDDTIYMIARHPDINGVAGCVRMTPTTFPTLSSLHFQHLFDRYGLPCDPQIYDSSRIVVDSATRGVGWASPVIAELLTGLLEAGEAMGLDAITGVIELKKMHALVASGWKIKPMGLPQVSGDLEIVAVHITPTAKSIARMRRLRRTNAPCFSEEGVRLLRNFHRAQIDGTDPQQNAA